MADEKQVEIQANDAQHALFIALEQGEVKSVSWQFSSVNGR